MTKKFYIQRTGNGQTETVDEFGNDPEAQKMLIEYRLSDRTAGYRISRRPCADWASKSGNIQPERQRVTV